MVYFHMAGHMMPCTHTHMGSGTGILLHVYTYVIIVECKYISI